MLNHSIALRFCCSDLPALFRCLAFSRVGSSLSLSIAPLSNFIIHIVQCLAASPSLPSLGTFQNVTSAGKASPGRIRTLKDQELMLNEYKKENFGLKLRIYHLEEALRKRWGEKDDGWKMVSFTL